MSNDNRLRQLAARERQARHRAECAPLWTAWFWRLETTKWRDRRIDLNREFQLRRQRRQRQRKTEAKE